jgi:hypothetical protein
MSERILRIEINCGEKTCIDHGPVGCRFKFNGHCDLFSRDLIVKRGLFLRCQTCLDAEVGDE